MRTLNKTILAVALATVTASAFADDAPAPAPSDFAFSGNLTFATDYRVRGISQTFKEPAVQGEFDIAHSSGLYVGAWASNVNTNFLNGASIEIDGYGGYKGKVTDDLTYDVGFINYYYPGQISGTASINTWDIYGGATWKWINVKYSQDLTDYFGVPNSKGTNYLETNVTIPLPADITLLAHYGHQSNKGSSFPVSSINDWKIGVSKDMLGLTWGLTYWDTNLPSSLGTVTVGGTTKNIANGAAILSVAKNF
jgi:uncharacterized protein (TIGR02001 family)